MMNDILEKMMCDVPSTPIEEIYAKKNDIFGDGTRLVNHAENLDSWDIFKNQNHTYLLNQKNKCDGLALLKAITDNVIGACFFDPQYRGVMDKLSYGNEGSRQIERSSLSQMSEEMIIEFIAEISRVLIPSRHLFLWVDKFHLCEGIERWFANTEFEIVDLIVWKKMTFGMGYRSRRTCEYMIILQKRPKRAKGVWTIRNIPDVWEEKIIGKTHTHQKPKELQKVLIRSTTAENDIILDPAAGSYSVMDATLDEKRRFLGTDVV